MAGFDNGVLVAKNANYDPTNILTSGQPPFLGQITANGQIFIGAASAPFLRPGLITGSAGITITNGPGTINISGSGSSSDLHVATYIVNSSGTSGTGANYQTISAAMAAATLAGAPGTIFIMPGTYTENITFTTGINLAAFDCDATTPNVSIVGRLTMTSAGSVSISGIRLTTNSDFFLAVTGSAASIVNINNCYLNCLNNTGITYTTSSPNSQINITFCRGNIATTGISLFASSSAGTIGLRYLGMENTGLSITKSTISAGGFLADKCYLGFPVTSSGTATVVMIYTEMVALGNAVALIVGGSGNALLQFCKLYGGTSQALTCTSTVNLYNCNIWSSNTNAIDGAGTVLFTDLTFQTSSLISTSTQTAARMIKGSYQVALPAGNYTCLGSDEIVGATSSGARAITLMSSPSTGQMVTIKDVTGTAAANNITITPAAGTIDGAATKVISANYGSVTLFYTGATWFSI